MKNKLNYLVSGFTLAICVTTLSGTSAIASPVQTPSETKSSAIEKPNKTENEDYNSTVVLNNSNGSEIININTFGTTVSEAIEDYGEDSKNYKTSDSETIEEDYSLKNGEDLTLFKSETSGDSEVIKLQPPTIKKKTDDLYIGEKETKSDGKEGKALKTTLVTKDLASDKKVNEEATGEDNNSTVEEKLTVLNAPKAKVILIGTKDRPEPVKTETSADDENESSEETNVDENEENSSSTESSNNSSSNEDYTSDDSSTNSENSSSSSSSPSSSSPKSSSKKSSGSTSSDIVQLAREQLGKPYVWGATGPNSFDCSGLIYYIYHTKKGMNIPRTSTAQGVASTPVSYSNIRPGDIVWKTGHIGIYVGGGKVIHAPRAGKPVTELSLSYFMNNGFKAGRF